MGLKFEPKSLLSRKSIRINEPLRSAPEELIVCDFSFRNLAIIEKLNSSPGNQLWSLVRTVFNGPSEPFIYLICDWLTVPTKSIYRLNRNTESTKCN